MLCLFSFFPPSFCEMDAGLQTWKYESVPGGMGWMRANPQEMKCGQALGAGCCPPRIRLAGFRILC